MTKQTRLSNLSFILLAIVILLCVNWLWQSDSQADQMEYSQVRQLFLQEKVESFSIDSGGTLTMELRGQEDGEEPVRYELYSFQLFYDDLTTWSRSSTPTGSSSTTTTRSPSAPTGCWSCCPSCWWRWSLG